MTRHIYLDNNATTALHPEVLEEMLPFFREHFGNPSSIHWAGRRVKTAVEEAREQVAILVGCDPSEVVFTSCATESNNMAIKGVAAARQALGNHIVTTTVEHPSVITPCVYLEHQGFKVTTLEVDNEGMLDQKALEAAVTDSTILLSAMYANNETGTLFPVREIGELAARKGICFHCDAVQAAGKIPLEWKNSNIHLLSLSAHKLQGPKGIGALIIRKGTKIFPLLHGGSQERNRRAGTENVAGIVGFGKACELATRTMATDSVRIAELRDRLERGIMETIPGVSLNGHPLKRLPNTSNLSFLEVKSDSFLFNLDLAGIAASSGSACSSGALKTSHVLKAMGIGRGAIVGNIRFSLGPGNSDADVDYLLDILPAIVQRLRGTDAAS
ncbi:MAG: cysteine desulfurase NifS [Deltaproteobacteria bacterium]|nr:cysteine desulfurase NifS [Deltaproteobacteria bacterium]TLN03004.1 MAG: cysteine desulfurase NifS [bacterium]